MSHHAKLDHAEIVSKDPPATQKFMEKAFGWKFAVMGPEMGNYIMHGKDQGAGGATIGIRSPMGPEGPTTVPYVTIPNIDEALKAVQAAGAKIVMPKTEIPKTAWIAVYVAPGEVQQGLYQAMPR